MVRRKKGRKIKKPIVDGIKFDSGEEAEIYKHLKKGTLHILTGIDELKDYKLLDAQPKSMRLYPGFKAGKYTQRARSYKWDFTCDYKGMEIHLEYKSSWSEKKPDYRLRRYLVLLNGTLNFVELVKIKKGKYELRKYF